MTKSSPAATDHWAVSTRTEGGVLTAGAALPSIELVLLGIPGGFTPVEIQSWLRDLGGVAIETSRADERSRPIPQLLHHALTGLLFSQTELWSHTGQPLPCAAVFVHGPQGVAFGWVGRARVVLLVNGEPHEPQWVIVRDEAGQEAMSAALPPDSHVLLTLEYWPNGEDATQAPASLDAEWGQSFANLVSSTPAIAQPAPQPAVVVPAEPQARRTARPLGNVTPSLAAKTESVLPTAQPGLAQDPSVPLDEPDANQKLPSTRNPSSGTFAMPGVPGAATSPVTDPIPAEPSALDELAASTDEAGHPVGRWLNKVIGFAKRAVTRQDPEFDAEVARIMATSPAPESGQPAAEASLSAPLQPAARATQVTPAIDPSSLAAAPIEPRLEATPIVARVAPPPVAVPPPIVAAALPPVAAKPVVPPPPPAAKREPAPERKPSIAPLAARTPAPASQPSAPAPRAGLAMSGLEEILGKRVPPKTGAAPNKRLEGLTATGIGGAASARGASSHSTDTPSSGTPYPVLDVTPVAPPARNPMEIEREPVGADSTFAIPRLPSLAPRSAPRVNVPTAADMMRRDAEVAARRAAAPPPASPPPAPPAATEAPAAVAPPPAPEPVVPDVPEPPTDFLEEFAASAPLVKSAPIQDSAPAAKNVPVEESIEVEGAPVVSVSAPAPAVEAPPEAIAPPVEEAPSAPPAPAEPVMPRGVSMMMQRPNLASAKRAAAVAAPVTPPPPPPTVTDPDPATPVLRMPTAAEPVPVAESEVPALMRELPLPAVEPEPAPDDVPEGMLIATPSAGTPPPRRYNRNEWPELEDGEKFQAKGWKNPTIIGVVVTILFGIGWIVGHSQSPDNDIHSTPMSRMMRSVGLGGARFTTAIETDPPGAFIAVDGKPISRRTPSTIELVPGNYKLTLSLPDLGEVVVPLTGKARQKVQVTEALHGSLEVTAQDNTVPVKMSLDGEPKGFLPVRIEELPPGLHEVQFSGPNMQPWGQTVNIGIRQKATLKARPMMSPATGVLAVQASLNDEGGTAPLEGATVYVDGEARGQTPLTIELSRGPHSLKVTYHGEVAPVQVIDLPGGNKRFASFQFGLDSDLPPLKLQSGYSTLSGKRSTLVEASLANLDWKDLREAWLHVRTGEGLWRRYQMTISEGANGALLSADFPTNAFDGNGRVTWYMSAATSQGDEFHTEMQRSSRSGQ